MRTLEKSFISRIPLRKLKFSFTKMYLKISSVKGSLSCYGIVGVSFNQNVTNLGPHDNIKCQHSNLFFIVKMVYLCKSCFITFYKKLASVFDSLGPSYTICHHETLSMLPQIMACCLTAPSHFLNQYRFIIGRGSWHLPEAIVVGNTKDINH